MSNRKLEILRTVSFSRLWNLFLLKLSFRISSILKKPIHWGTPVAVSIEPTTACNLKCPQCPSGLRQFTRPTGNLKLETNKTILDGLGKNLQYINYYFQGEPFINPNFLEVVKEARKRNIYVLTSTNAHFISEKTAEEIIDSKLSEIIISIDGATQETYENYRIEGKLEKVIEGTKNLIEAKKKRKSNLPIVTFQFLVSKQNEHEIDRIKSLKKEMGVDELRFKTIQVYDFETGNDLIPENDKYSRYRKNNDGGYELKNAYKNSCWRSWSSCVFTWDASVVPCCFDKDANHKMGNLNEQEFKAIWKGAIYKDFTQQILKSRKQIEICRNCSEGSKIWI